MTGSKTVAHHREVADRGHVACGTSHYVDVQLAHRDAPCTRGERPATGGTA